MLGQLCVSHGSFQVYLQSHLPNGYEQKLPYDTLPRSGLHHVNAFLVAPLPAYPSIQKYSGYNSFPFRSMALLCSFISITGAKRLFFFYCQLCAEALPLLSKGSRCVPAVQGVPWGRAVGRQAEDPGGGWGTAAMELGTCRGEQWRWGPVGRSDGGRNLQGEAMEVGTCRGERCSRPRAACTGREGGMLFDRTACSVPAAQVISSGP